MGKRTAQDKPEFAQSSKPLTIVVEGVGDVIKNYYDEAFRNLKAVLKKQRALRVTFIDKSEYWKNNSALAEKITAIINSVQNWGAAYLDKSNPADFETYKRLKPDVVLITTPDFAHVEVAEEWLSRSRVPEQIFIEKPLDASLDAARKLLGKLKPYDDSLLSFDHYRARLLPTKTQYQTILGFLGKGLSHFTFYFLEDHSSADPLYQPTGVSRDGAIENEQRVKTLNQGVILDAIPHMIALLAYFGRVEAMRVTRVRAGQYVGVDADLKRRTDIDQETFAEVGFVFPDYADNPVTGTAYVGKGIRGVKILGESYDHNAKVLDIKGKNGNIIRFDLRSSGDTASRAMLIEKGRTQLEFPLTRKPYHLFLEKVADGSYRQDRLALNAEIGKRTLEVMQDMRYPVPDKMQIPTYPGGMRDFRPSLYLEDILENHLPILYGSNAPLSDCLIDVNKAK